MTQPGKTVIVSVDHDDYGRMISARRLTPGTCFQALDIGEAMRVIAANQRWDIAVTVLTTPEWDALHGRKGRVA